MEISHIDPLENPHPPSFSTTDSTYYHLSILFAYTDLTNWTSIYLLDEAYCWGRSWTWSSSFVLLPLARVRLCVAFSTPQPSGQLLLSSHLCSCAPKRLQTPPRIRATSHFHIPDTLTNALPYGKRGRLPKSMVHGTLQESSRRPTVNTIMETICAMVAKSTNSGAQLPVFRSWLPPISALWPYANYLTSLSLNLPK